MWLLQLSSEGAASEHSAGSTAGLSIAQPENGARHRREAVHTALPAATAKDPSAAAPEAAGRGSARHPGNAAA